MPVCQAGQRPGSPSSRRHPRPESHGPGPSLEGDDGHEASRQFGSAVYNSIRDLTAQIRKDHPDLTPDQALQQARQAVGSDLHRSLEFLPNSNVNSQEAQAQAMMKAGRVDRSGSSHDIYMKNFRAAGLAVQDDGPE